MPETFRPLGDRVLVRPLKPKPKSDSLLDTGDAGKEDEVLRGEVVVISKPLAEKIDFGPSPVTVCYAQYSGRAHKFDGEELLILTEEEILGVIEP